MKWKKEDHFQTLSNTGSLFVASFPGHRVVFVLRTKIDFLLKQVKCSLLALKRDKWSSRYGGIRIK